MFRRLCSVSGVGPRTALGVLSTLSLRDLSLAILAGDAVAIARAPNVGKKTAQRIILELKERWTVRMRPLAAWPRRLR